MPGILGPQIQHWGPGVLDEVLTLPGPAIKVLNTAAEYEPVARWLDRNPRSGVIIRQVWGNPSDELARATGTGAAVHQTLDTILATFEGPIRAAREQSRWIAVEPSNEVIDPWHKLVEVSRFYSEFGPLAQAAGLITIAYSWPAGNPPGYGSADDPNHYNPAYATRADSLAAFLLAMDFDNGAEACGWNIGYHPYGAIVANNAEWPYLAGRPRLVLDAIRIAYGDAVARRIVWWFTEALIDGGVYSGIKGKPAGWRSQLEGMPDPEATYADDIRAAVLRWRTDGLNVAVCTPFLHGPFGDWNAAGFGLDNTPKIAAMWRAINEDTAASVPQGGSMDYEGIDIQVTPGVAVPGQQWRGVVSAQFKKTGEKTRDGVLTVYTNLPRNAEGYLYTTRWNNDRHAYAMNKDGEAVAAFDVPEDIVPADHAGGSIGLQVVVQDFSDDGKMIGFGSTNVTVPIQRAKPADLPPGPSPAQPGPTPRVSPTVEDPATPAEGTGYHRIFALAGRMDSYAEKIKADVREIHMEIDREKAKEAQRPNR